MSSSSNSFFILEAAQEGPMRPTKANAKHMLFQKQIKKKTFSIRNIADMVQTHECARSLTRNVFIDSSPENVK